MRRAVPTARKAFFFPNRILQQQQCANVSCVGAPLCGLQLRVQIVQLGIALVIHDVRVAVARRSR